MNTKDAILSSTNYGLDIILHYYPQAANCLSGRNKHFKIRDDEKTASSSIKLVGDCYIITDFGGDGKGKNCFTIVQEAERLATFGDALSFIVKTWQIAGLENSHISHEPKKDYRDALVDEIEGSRLFETKEEMSNSELRQLFAEKIYVKYKDNLKHLKDVCTKYNLTSLINYTIIKNRKAIVISSTEEYPIFMWDFGDFKKIYQPKSKDKSRRFFYIGTKPQNFICGYSQLDKAYNKLQDELQSEESEDVDTDKPKKRKSKLLHAIICTGGSDALNVAALSAENHVLWMNSESEKLLPTGKNDLNKKRLYYGYSDISSKVDTIYNIPDIDLTGITQGHALAMEYLDIKTVWLPIELSYHRDFRGNSCKDVRDYFKHYKLNSFDDLLKMAYPYRFWDLEPKFDKDKNFKKYEFTFNNRHAYNFLVRNGFCRIEDKNNKEGHIFTHINGNIVKEVLPSKMRDYIVSFLEERKAETDLFNMVYRTTQVKDSSMSNLPVKNIEFKDSDKDYQYMFFQNKTWKITRFSIEEFKPGAVNCFTWDNEVIKHDVKLMPDFFKVEYDKGLERYNIKIENTDSILFKFLINTANMHWRVTEYGITEKNDKNEDVERKELTKSEEYENQIHLINRLYTLGYMMHRYKNPSKAWCPYFMENKVTEESVSNGGSGKSICANIPAHYMNTIPLDGRNPDLLANNHWTENITEHVDLLHFEDMHQYSKFNVLYNLITGPMPVNPKHSRGYTLPFELSPKLVMSSNYAIKDLDQSSRRRLLFSVFSDYYHHGPNDEFDSARTPESEFGMILFKDFDENQWNLASNLVAQCIKLFLTIPKIDPPMVNVEKRNLLGVMGDAFFDWADVYFSPLSGRLNVNTVKQDAFINFTSITKSKFTANRFKAALIAYCKYKEYVFNPKEIVNSGDRIIGTSFNTITNKNESVEMIHIRTADFKTLVTTSMDFNKNVNTDIANTSSDIVSTSEKGGLPF